MKKTSPETARGQRTAQLRPMNVGQALSPVHPVEVDARHKSGDLAESRQKPRIPGVFATPENPGSIPSTRLATDPDIPAPKQADFSKNPYGGNRVRQFPALMSHLVERYLSGRGIGNVGKDKSATRRILAYTTATI